MKKPSLHLGSIKETAFSLLRGIAERIFLAFLLLFFLALSLTGLVWYQSFHMDLSTRKEPETIFRHDRFLEVIRIQEDRAEHIKTIPSKEYRDVFSSPQKIDTSD